MQIEKHNDIIDAYIYTTDSEDDLCGLVMFAETSGCNRLIIQSEDAIPEGTFEEIHIGELTLTRSTPYSVVYELI
ncbi:MAG: hypothetical protein ACRCX2_39350 [Paraclostridium sp.]